MSEYPNIKKLKESDPKTYRRMQAAARIAIKANRRSGKLKGKLDEDFYIIAEMEKLEDE